MIDATDNIELTDRDKLLSQPKAKWGDAIEAGYQVLPDALLRGQHLLELSPTDIVVIANLNQAWWFADRRPYIQPHTIAKRMGVSERTVQRSLSRLRSRGYLNQIREVQWDGTVRYSHDLSGLRLALEPLAHRDIRYSANQRSVVAEQSQTTPSRSSSSRERLQGEILPT